MFKIFICMCLALFLMVQGAPVRQDLDASASEHEHHGRVQIKVYRGPTEHDGHDHFAPWGYWVKQPADEDHHY